MHCVHIFLFFLPDLKNFIESNLPKKTKKFVLGVLDSKLGGALADTLNIKCSHIGVVPEIIRGVRFHFAKLVKGEFVFQAFSTPLG